MSVIYDVYLSTYRITGQIATHPMDVIKIHMHMTNESLYGTVKQTVNNAGWRGFYVGLTAGLLRQITYSTTRLGVYSTMLEICRWFNNEYFDPSLRTNCETDDSRNFFFSFSSSSIRYSKRALRSLELPSAGEPGNDSRHSRSPGRHASRSRDGTNDIRREEKSG